MIGIFGGAFDPPHSEHIKIARQAAREFSLEKVVFVPSGTSPHKKLQTSFADRFAMVQKAIEGTGFLADDVEDSFSEPAYSYKVLPLLKQKYGDILFLIGGDSLLHFDSWRNPQEILKICPIAVIPRGTDEIEELAKVAKDLTHRYGGDIIIAKSVRGENLSSSYVRAEVALDLPIPEVPEEVAKIILSKGLYREYDPMIATVRGMLQEKRWRHTCGVVLAGIKINERIGLPRDKVFISCLLHDCMKQCDRVNPGVPEDVIGSKVLHAFNGAEEARLAFHITDEEVIDAIRYHTTARAAMTPLDKLVYTADMVEELTRDFEGVKELREIAYRDLDKAFLLCFKECYDLLLEKGNPIYHLTLECYDYYFKGE